MASGSKTEDEEAQKKKEKEERAAKAANDAAEAATKVSTPGSGESVFDVMKKEQELLDSL